MDAATRAELDALRLRAYGPAADIDNDPAAAERLLALEEAASRERTSVSTSREEPTARPLETGEDRDFSRDLDSERAAPPTAGPRTADPPPSAPPVAAAPATAPLSRRAAIAFAAIGGAMILAIGGVVLVRALLPPEREEATRAFVAPAVRDARTAYSFAWDRDAVPLLHIPLDGSFGRYIDLPSATEVPEFPATGTVEWAYPLGKYFGWDVWIAGASVDATGLQREHCIVIERDDDARGRCVPAQLRPQSALLVSVPYASIAPEDRPVGMREDERIGFWWNHDRAVTVMIGDDP